MEAINIKPGVRDARSRPKANAHAKKNRQWGKQRVATLITRRPTRSLSKTLHAQLYPSPCEAMLSRVPFKQKRPLQAMSPMLNGRETLSFSGEKDRFELHLGIPIRQIMNGKRLDPPIKSSGTFDSTP